MPLEPGRSGGDLCIQACADDPLIAVHAVRNLSRIAFGAAAMRWSPSPTATTTSDGMHEYLKHTGSALIAVPPGVRRGGYVGEPLFT